ncbi:MAG: ComEC/Rec2 family competence protein, partial [Pseudoclavibacter sp.]
DAAAGDANRWEPGGDLGSARYEVRATAIDLGDGWRPVAVPLLVFGSIEAVDGGAATGDAQGDRAPPAAPSAAPRPPGIGAEVVLEARLSEFDGGADRTLMAFATDAARQTAKQHPLLAWADELRHRFVAEASALPGAGGQLLPGLAVGDTRALDAGLEDDMKTSSLSHLVAVSGSNCVLIVGGIVLLGRLLGIPRGVRIAAAGAALAGFVVIVTPEGSVIRAAAMASIVLAVDGWGRKVRGAPVLCLATIVLLAASPALGADYGFALSVAATAGLLLGTRPLAERLERWMPRWLAVALAVPVAAQLACQPILILLQPVIPTYGVVANLLAAPAAPIATLVGLVGAILATVAPAVAPVALWIGWTPAQWIGVIATGTAGWPLASVPWPGGLGGALLLGAATAAAIIAWLVRPGGTAGVRIGGRHRRAGRHGLVRRGRWMQALAGAAVIALLAVMAGSGLGTALVRSASFPDDWRYAACDIGQGDAIVVRAGDAVALIDTGPDPEPLEACLDLLGVERIDVLVLSHFDHDHDGAAGDIADRVDALVVPRTREAMAEPIVEQYATNGIRVMAAVAGDTWRIGDTAWRALWPRASADGGPSASSGNDGSLTVHVTPATGPTLLSLGDLGERPQQQVLRAAERAAGSEGVGPGAPGAPMPGAGAGAPQTVPALRADIVKVSHHGSGDQAPELYAATGARLALVSVGAGNSYGHPTSDALAMLDAAHMATARTDLLGTIVVGGSSAVRTGEDAALTVWSAGAPAPEGAGFAGSSPAKRSPPTPRPLAERERPGSAEVEECVTPSRRSAGCRTRGYRRPRARARSRSP